MRLLTAFALLLISSTSFAAESRDSTKPGALDHAKGGITDGSSATLRSDWSSLGAVAQRETAGPDTFAIYGGPDRPLEGRFEDAGGSAAWNGWTSVDMTDLPVYWHVDLFNAENLNGNGAGNHAMWSGQSALDQPDWATPPGYGNWWNDTLIYESGTVADPTAGQTVSLDFFFNHELEPVWDFFIVEYDSAGIWTELYRTDDTNKDSSGVFAAPGVRFSDVATKDIVFAGNDYGGGAGDQIRIRMRVASDGGWSDQDGLFPTAAGAVQLDEIMLTSSEGSFAETFEGPGPYLFVPDKAPFVGDFAEIYPGFADIDPCRSNYTPVVGFIDYGREVRNGPAPDGTTSTGGSTSAGVSYGIPGNWVTNYTGGLTFGAQGLQNVILSPEVLWDLPAAADDEIEIAGSILRFDIWQHLPIQNGIFFAWEVRSAAAGEAFGPWQWDGWFYFSLGAVWTTKRFEMNGMLVDYPERVQARLWVMDLADAFGYPGNAGTPSPVYDNVSMHKYRMQGIEISGRSIHVPNDSFPPSGSIDVSTAAARNALDVPIDMAMDVNGGSTFIVPGDSIAVTALPLIPGTELQDLRLVWAMQTNPLFEDALRTAPSGPNHFNVIAGPAGTVWSGETAGEPCTNAVGDIVADRYFFDLPDVDFMYPGDVIQYYIRAVDNDGRISTLPTDLSAFGHFDHVYPRYGTAHALPSISDDAGTQPPILVLNDTGNEINFPTLAYSMSELGLAEGTDYDIYWKREPSSSPNSNGIGSGGAHGATAQQIEGYSTILYFSRHKYAVLLAGGPDAFWSTKSDDIALMEAWHRLPGRRNVAYFGDRLAESLTYFPSGLSYLNNTMGVEYVGRDVVPFLGGQLSPTARPLHPAFSAEYLTYFNCQIDSDDATNIGVIPHNHLEPAAGATYGHKYVDAGSGVVVNGAAASVVFPNPYPGVTGYDVTFPYSISWLYPSVQRTVGFSDRTVLLQELLNLFDEGSGTPPAVAAPAKASLNLRTAPNPFNPRTVVHFDVAFGQRGDVRVFNLRGELVKTLHSGEYQAREFIWDGADDNGKSVASGVYVVQASADGDVRVAKVALVR